MFGLEQFKVLGGEINYFFHFGVSNNGLCL